ncbi:MAG: hypothetical protein Q9217_006050 [Psora testacea]
MFSYLHGIRPNNKRPAITSAISSHNANAGRGYHESSLNPNRSDLYPPPAHHSQHNSLDQAFPVPHAPPLLPPIPRVASQHASQSQEYTDYERGPTDLGTAPARGNGLSDCTHMPSALRDNKGEEPITSTSSGEKAYERPQIEAPPIATEQPRPASGRPKRPIDIKFEQMRAYSEPPFRQSIYMPKDNVHGITQPYYAPPPPPLKMLHSSSPPQGLNLSEARQRGELQIPGKGSVDSRYQTWNGRTVDHSQPQTSMRTTFPPSDPSRQSTLASQHRHSKAKLNLLNPMTLLARRRSHQAVEAAYAERQNPLALQLPDDYDPRIRGKVVHDFSAPRPGRTPVTKNNDGHTQDSVANESSKYSAARRGESPSRAEREHAPVFKEHFDDGLEKSQDPANKPSTFLHQMSVQASQPQPDPSHLPAFARKLPSMISANVDSNLTTPPPPPSAALHVLLEAPDKEQTPALPSPPTSPPRVASTAASISDVTAQGPGSPKRYKSNASRFSFDLAGVGSTAQEKLLEDKHRQKASRTQRESMMDDEVVEDQYDGIDYDDMEGDGYEERIPGVNCDEDDEITENNNMPVLQRNIESFNLISPNKSSFESNTSPVSTGVTSLDTPRDFLGQQVGFTVSKSSTDLAQPQSEKALQGPEKEKGLQPRSPPDESLHSVAQTQPPQREVALETELAGLSQRQAYSVDDIYFDDGMIDDIGDVSDEEFDENVFDDNSNSLYGLPLRDRTLRPPPEPGVEFGKGLKSGLEETLVPQNSVDTQMFGANPSPHRSLGSDECRAELGDALTELNQHNQPVFRQTAGLTQDNLAAYNHNALSIAVNQAAIKGAFERTLSLGSSQGPGEANPTQNSRGETGQIVLEPPESADFDNYDDGPDDDPIVAAANAEALENDEEGFYGQEFGFFARSSGSCEAEYSNGGYFGPRALEDMHRSHSGKGNFQEPSLTPITERSEWSNRNSTISLVLHGQTSSVVSATSPQIGDMPLDDVNMQLAMLKQLRRGAWGGSDVSLQSSSNSQNSGSPLTHLPTNLLWPSPLQASNSNVNLQNMASSFHSFSSSNGQASSNESDPSSLADSPTITFTTAQAMPAQKAPAVAASTTQSMDVPTQPAMPPPPIPAPAHETPATTRNGRPKAYKRNSSFAESVSYKEEGGRWVIEKRRTSETGEQILGRTLVQGGRI